MKVYLVYFNDTIEKVFRYRKDADNYAKQWRKIIGKGFYKVIGFNVDEGGAE